MANNPERKPSPVFSRREFLKLMGAAGVAAVVGSCQRKVLVAKESLPPPTKTAAPEIIIPTLTPIPTETPQEAVILTTEANLVNLAENYPFASFDDPYYPWYCLNGGEKLFDPWAIPAGTSLLIPEENKELLA